MKISKSSFNSYNAGLWAEFVARLYLRLRGFKILENRYITGRNTGRAEIDIIASRGSLIVFIEVKNRPNLESAFDAITSHQATRLRLSAENYLKRKKWNGNSRFDVIVVSKMKVKWIKNAL